MDLSNCKILFIHGLSSKPPRDVLFERWRRCLLVNLGFYEEELRRAMEDRSDDLFEMAYWANVIPDHIEFDPDGSEYLIEELLKHRSDVGDEFHVPLDREKFRHFWIDKALDAVDIVANVLSVKDDIAKKKLEELRLYWDDQYMAHRIREKLSGPLRTALNEGRDVAILAHSMGTFVAYDVLWRFAHHREDEDMWGKRVRLLVTMGSPLGDPMIQSLLLGKRYGYEERRGLLTNVDYWANFAALGDIVSHDASLTDDFKAMVDLDLIRDFRDYRELYNPYRNLRGKMNPHKSYGYLLQPKLAKTMLRFLGTIEW
jgi:hypothetical protein